MRMPRLRFREFLLVTLLISLLTATYSIRHKTWRGEVALGHSSDANRARISARGVDDQIAWAKERLAKHPVITDADVSKYDVMILSEDWDERDFPKEHQDLVIVASRDEVYGFRVFDGEGKVLTTWMQALPEPLDRYVRTLKPPHQLTRGEKDKVVGILSALLEGARSEYQASLKTIEDRKVSELAEAERLEQLARQP